MSDKAVDLMASLEASVLRAKIDRLTVERDDAWQMLAHYQGWFGDECPCDEEDCPL